MSVVGHLWRQKYCALAAFGVTKIDARKITKRPVEQAHKLPWTTSKPDDFVWEQVALGAIMCYASDTFASRHPWASYDILTIFFIYLYISFDLNFSKS